jgi:hypothetical protein
MIDVGHRKTVPLFSFSADCDVEQKVSNSVLRDPALIPGCLLASEIPADSDGGEFASSARSFGV